MQQRAGPGQAVGGQYRDAQADRRAGRGHAEADQDRPGDHATCEQLPVGGEGQLAGRRDQPAGPRHGLLGGQAGQHDHVDREEDGRHDEREHESLGEPAGAAGPFGPGG
ncbi:hypothetical protein GCM10027187_52850 [Streptosporangium sandarakinum]